MVGFGQWLYDGENGESMKTGREVLEHLDVDEGGAIMGVTWFGSITAIFYAFCYHRECET
jgi:hypothetical protein